MTNAHECNGLTTEAGLATVLVIYHRAPLTPWRSTYRSHLESLSRYSSHQCFHFNTARPSAPAYIASLNPDLVVFHYTFLAHRQVPEDFAEHCKRVVFTKGMDCPKVLVPHDEQAHADLLVSFCRDFGISHVMTPAPPEEWRNIYRGLDFETTKFQRVLTGYIDDATVQRHAAWSAAERDRPIDIGYRSWSTGPYYGRHGMLKRQIGEVFAAAAVQHGLSTDISGRPQDAKLEEEWFEFLLDCRYTIGVEGGSSVFDYDGSIASRTKQYLADHENASFQEVEAACFPEADGRFNYRLLGPRHLEAAVTRTGQALIEGEYAGALKPGVHYLEIKRDFSNLDHVVEMMKDEDLRLSMVERAYQDVVESGKFSYQSFAQQVHAFCLPAASDIGPWSRLMVCRNRLDEAAWPFMSSAMWARVRSQVLLWRDSTRQAIASTLRPVASAALGETRLRRILARLRGQRQ